MVMPLARTERYDAMADAYNRIDPERQDIERRLSALDKPISKATAKTETLKAELESAEAEALRLTERWEALEAIAAASGGR